LTGFNYGRGQFTQKPAIKTAAKRKRIPIQRMSLQTFDCIGAVFGIRQFRVVRLSFQMESWESSWPAPAAHELFGGPTCPNDGRTKRRLRTAGPMMKMTKTHKETALPAYQPGHRPPVLSTVSKINMASTNTAPEPTAAYFTAIPQKTGSKFGRSLWLMRIRLAKA